MNDIGTDRLRWGEVIDLVLETLREPTSHLRLEMADENFPITQPEANLLMLVGGLAGLKGEKLDALLPSKRKEARIDKEERDKAHNKLLELYGIKK